VEGYRVPSIEELTGKVAVVMGASSGIERAIAERLGAADAHLQLAARTIPTPSGRESSKATGLGLSNHVA